MRMTKKKTAILLFSIAFILMLVVAGLAIHSSRQPDPTLPPPLPPVDTDILVSKQGENGLWGYVNSRGSFFVEPQYEEVTPFVGKYAWVKKSGSWGAIGTDGKVFVDFTYSYLRSAGEGFVIVKSGATESLYNPAFQKIFGVDGNIRNLVGEHFVFSRQKNSKPLFGCCDKQGKIVIEPAYNGLSDVSAGKVMAVTDSGEKVLLDIYGATLGHFPASTDLADLGENSVVYMSNAGIWGYYDVTGDVLLPPSWHYATPFRNGVALVKKDDYWALINSAGKAIVDYKYTDAMHMGGGAYILSLANGNAILMKGDRLITEDIVAFGSPQSGALPLVRDDGKTVVYIEGYGIPSYAETGKYKIDYKINNDGKIIPN